MPSRADYNGILKEGLGYLELTFFLAVLLYFGKTLFVPVLFGLLVAFIAYPVCKRLESGGWKRAPAIALVIIIVAIVFGLLLLLLLSYELNVFLRDLPLVSGKLRSQVPGFKNWVMEITGIDLATQESWYNKIIGDVQNGLSSYLRNFLNATVSTLFILVMTPIYASLFLYHRGTFVKCLESLTGSVHRSKLHQVLRHSILSYFHFVKGTFFVYLVVGTLNSIGLLALGIPHAILYGMLTAFMTIIPYIGIIVSASMPVTIALVTKDSVWYPVAVIVLFTFVQYLEANIIFPRIVAAQLNLSTWSTLIAIVAGTIIWGVAGMILFIPVLAIFKIVSDQVDGLKSINILLNRKEGYQGS